MWILHKLTTTKDENYRVNIEKGYNILEWNT